MSPTPRERILTDNSFQPLEKTDANTNDGNAKEEGEKGIRSCKIPNQTNSLRDNSAGFCEQATNGNSSFSRDNSSFKVDELIALGAGTGIEPVAPDHDTGMLPATLSRHLYYLTVPLPAQIRNAGKRNCITN